MKGLLKVSKEKVIEIKRYYDDHGIIRKQKNQWIWVEPYRILLHAWSVVWRGTSWRSVHSDNVWIRFDAGCLNACLKVKRQAGLRADGIDDDWGQDIVRDRDAPDREFQRGDAPHHHGQCLDWTTVSPPGNPFREVKAGSCDARAGFAFPVGMDACASIPRCTLATWPSLSCVT